jgi:hypothetical protein
MQSMKHIPRPGVLFALLTILALMASPANAQLREAPWGPYQFAASDFDVRLDALPDVLVPDEIEVVVEVSDEYCQPRHKKLLGISLPVPVAPETAFFCRHLATHLAGPTGPLPVRASRQTWTQRNPGELVAALDPAPQRRYVLLSRWRFYEGVVSQYGVVQEVRWVVEELVWDRHEGHPVWHGLRTINTNDDFKGGKVLGMQLHLRRHFHFTLHALLTARAAVRHHAPVPSSQWVAADQMAGWTSTSRSAIAFVNNYSSPGRRRFSRSHAFPVRADAQAPQARVGVDWGSEAWMQWGQTPGLAATPPMDYRSHALLELPPGRYLVGSEDPALPKPLLVEVAAGELAVVELSRKLVGADAAERADLKTWQTALTRGRHAFLEDRRVLAEPWQVDTWFQLPNAASVPAPLSPAVR